MTRERAPAEYAEYEEGREGGGPQRVQRTQRKRKNWKTNGLVRAYGAHGGNHGGKEREKREKWREKKLTRRGGGRGGKRKQNEGRSGGFALDGREGIGQSWGRREGFQSSAARGESA